MISVIIPTYNEEKYIEDCLEQFTGLTIPHEIIVTDDKSKDQTVVIAKKYTAHILVPTQKHRTIAANRNAGAEVAQGSFLLFIDTDSRIFQIQTALEKALQLFNDNPKLVALTGLLKVNPETETFMDSIVYTVFNWVHRFKNNVIKTGEASGKFQMIRKEAFLKVGGFREDLVAREDADMFQRLSKVGEVRCEKEIRILHSGRRGHTLGWPKLLWIWGINTLWFMLFDRSKAKVWKAIR